MSFAFLHTHIPQFLTSLSSSPTPQTLIASRYMSVLQTHHLNLEYCRVYLYYLELRKRVVVERKQIERLRQKIERVSQRLALGQETLKKETMVEGLSTKEGRHQDAEVGIISDQGQSGDAQKFQLQGGSQYEPEKQIYQQEFENQVIQTPEKPLRNTHSNKLQSTANPTAKHSKRCRRAAQSISRHWQCLFEGCAKKYGSEGSLKYHMKLKHPAQGKKSYIVNLGDEEDNSIGDK